MMIAYFVKRLSKMTMMLYNATIVIIGAIINASNQQNHHSKDYQKKRDGTVRIDVKIKYRQP